MGEVDIRYCGLIFQFPCYIYNILTMNFLILEKRRATHVEVRIKFAFCPPLAPASWNCGPGQCGPQRKWRMPGRSCLEWELGHRLGRWSGNGQFHLMKHECGCLIFWKKTNLRDGTEGINCRLPGPLGLVSRGYRQGLSGPRNLSRFPSGAAWSAFPAFLAHSVRDLAPDRHPCPVMGIRPHTVGGGRGRMTAGRQAFTPQWPTERRDGWPFLHTRMRKATVFRAVSSLLMWGCAPYKPTRGETEC